jgi:hypothetical protein
MKVFIITLALAGLASAASVDAQIMGSNNRLPTSNRGTSVDGSWRAIGRDNNGNTIYERRVQDSYGNIVVQRARRDGNGNLSIISSQNVGSTSNRNGCTTNSVGDIVFGRSGNANCDNRSSNVGGGWYQVGRDRNGNTLYERRTRDSNGNVIIQRARQDSYGNMSIISSRRASNGNGTDNNGRGRNNRGNGDDNENGNYQNGNYQNGNYQNDDSGYRGNDNSRNDNESKGNGRGKSNGKGKHKGND